MKTINVIIVCITAIICTALLTFAAIKRSHHRFNKNWECHRGNGVCGAHGGFCHEGEMSKGRHEFGGPGHCGKEFNPEAAAARQTEFMKEKLSLNDEQAKKVEAINLKYAEKRKEIMQGVKGQMETIHSEKVKELSTVLNKEQLEKVKQFKNRWEHGEHSSITEGHNGEE